MPAEYSSLRNNQKVLRKHEPLDASSLSYGANYFGMRKIQNKMPTRPQGTAYLRITEPSVTNYCSDNNELQKIPKVLPLCFHTAHSASRQGL
jgi:hypothetical protein